MRNTIFIIGLLLCSICSFCQSNTVEKFIETYNKKAEVNSLTLNDWSLQLTSSFTKEDTGKQLLKKITRLRLLTFDEQIQIQQEDIRRLIKNLRKDQYESLLEVRDKGSQVKFLIRENEEYITDVLMLAQGKDSFILLSLEGLFKFEDLKNLQIDVEGGDHFKRLEEVDRA